MDGFKYAADLKVVLPPAMKVASTQTEFMFSEMIYAHLAMSDMSLKTEHSFVY